MNALNQIRFVYASSIETTIKLNKGMRLIYRLTWLQFFAAGKRSLRVEEKIASSVTNTVLFIGQCKIETHFYYAADLYP
jgi:hypothetical protein